MDGWIYTFDSLVITSQFLFFLSSILPSLSFSSIRDDNPSLLLISYPYYLSYTRCHDVQHPFSLLFSTRGEPVRHSALAVSGSIRRQ